MLALLPKTNSRQASDIHDELEAIASVFLPEWRGMESDGEFGQALFEIIARLGEHVSTRMEKTAWRDAVAFFDSLDIPVQAPRPAAAPLVFLLGEKVNSPVFAPAGVQVGAQAEGGELLFESLEAVTLTPARLEFIAAVDTDKDSIELPAPGFLELEPPEGPLPTFFAASYADKKSQTIQIEPFEDLNSGDQIKIGESVYRLEEGQDGLFTLMDPLETDIEEGTEIHKVLNFEAFNNRNLQEHVLYIGHSELLNLEQETAIILDITPQSLAASLTSESGEWQLYGVENDDPPSWHVLTNMPESRQIGLLKDGSIKAEKTEVNGINTYWIRYVFNDTDPALSFDTRLAGIEMNIKTLPGDIPIESNEVVDPLGVRRSVPSGNDEAFKSITHAFHNNVPLSLEPGLAPFGPEPLRFDTFSISAPEVFSKKGADISLFIFPGPQNGGKESGEPKLGWEYFNGNGWQSLKLNNDPKYGHFNFRTKGNINFTVPDDIDIGNVAGVEGYWIRARLIGGDYGRPSYEVAFSFLPDHNNFQDPFLIESISIDPSTVTPPRLKSIEITIETTSPVQPEAVLSQNNLDYLNHTQASQKKHASFKLLQNARDINGYLTPANETETSNNVLYFGFNKSFDIRPLSMLVDAEEQERNVDLDFEVLARDDWEKVTAIDETAGFHRRGFARVFIDFKPRLARLFGQESYWLRVRPHHSDIHNWAPKLRSVFINAVRAKQAKSIKNEVLGSSAGEPNLKVVLSNQPVLPGSMELRIRENLSDEEHDMLMSDTDDPPDHRLPVRNFEEPFLQGDWVLWNQVDSFIGLGPEDRVYRLDPVTGEIQFGNDRQGRIPPAGSGHIRAIHYQTGGGTQGNVGAYAITALKSGVEGVEKVANPVQAAGGTDAPDIEQQIEHAPARLRRAGQAMTPPDIEALVVSTSPDMIRARCLFPESFEDPVLVAILMRNGTRCPKPTLAEQDALARLIRTQSWGGLQQDDVKVIAPHYVPVELTLRVVPDSNENSAKLEQAATNRIRLLLHPTDGGPAGSGWPFGRRVWESDILRALAEIPSFDAVQELNLAPKKQDMDFDRIPEVGMICALEEDIRVSVEPGDGAG